MINTLSLRKTSRKRSTSNGPISMVNKGPRKLRKFRDFPTKGVAFIAKQTASATTSAVSLPINSLTAIAKQCKKAAKITLESLRPKIIQEEEPLTEIDPNLSVIPELAPVRQPSKLEILISEAMSDDEARSRLAQTALQHVQELYNDTMLAKCNAETLAEALLDLILECATSVVKDYKVAKFYLQEEADGNEELETLRQMFAIVQQSLEQHLEPRVFFCTFLDATTSPEEAHRVLEWVSDYFDVIGEPNCDSHPWAKHFQHLWNIYLERGVKGSMESFRTTGGLKLEVGGDDNLFETQEGSLITCYASAIANIYNFQLRLVSKLPARCTGEVVSACNEQFLIFVGEMMIEVGIRWMELSTERLCSIINDVATICNASDERNANNLVKEEHIAIGENFCQALTELSVFTTKQLAEHIMRDMEDPESILNAVGNGEVWEESCAVQRMNATLMDYFEDLERWIQSPDFFFPKVLKFSFDLALQRYIVSFLGNSIAGRTGSAQLAAEVMRRDYGNFDTFWNGPMVSTYHGVAGFYSQEAINRRLHLLLSMSMIVSPQVNPVEVQEEMETVMVELGDNGIPAILHLVGLRGRNSCVDSLEWHEMLAKGEAITQAAGYQRTASHSYSLPDLRNSKFLTNVQPPRERKLVQRLRQRKNSEAIDISSTRALVKSRNLQRTKQRFNGSRVRKLLRS